MAISPKELEININDDDMRLKISALERTLAKIYEGGGKKRIEKLHEQGKLTARERIDLLLDPNTERIEIGALAGYEMYPEHGGCPSGGVVIVIGYVKGKQCIVVANDATVKAGAWFPITGKKEPACAGDRDGKPVTDHLPGRQCRSVPPDAGRDFPG